MATELPEKPLSRKESYLAAIAGESVELPEAPESRTEQYLAYIAENGGGGGGGTNNFNQLTNRPKYNNTTMTGNTNIPKVPTKTSELNNDSNFVTSSDLPTVNDGTLTITQNGTTVGTFTANDADDATIALTDTTYSPFTGTDGTAAGTAGLVPAPTTSDTDKYLKSDGSWATVSGGGGTTYTAGDGIDITNAVISATNTGKPKVLTSADYDYPDANPTGIALWRLEPGLYIVSSGTTAYSSIYFNTPQIAYKGLYLIAIDNNNANTNIIYFSDGGAPKFAKTVIANGERISAFEYFVPVVDNLTSPIASNALSANQGRVLKNLVDSIAIRGSGAPTTSTVGSVGTLYEDTTNGKLYQCTDTTGGSYTWVEVGAGGGSGPTVVQTTGTSTTDVMSQNAVTSMVFADPATQYKIKIGAGASSSEGSNGIEIGRGAQATGLSSVTLGYQAIASKTNSVAIGQGATAAYANSVAIGKDATSTRAGEVNIGSGSSQNGFNDSEYRVLGGLYDPQSAHDAATKGYVDPTTDSSAPTTATVGRMGQIFIDTTNAAAYMCVAVDSVTPSYTWRKITAA